MNDDFFNNPFVGELVEEVPLHTKINDPQFGASSVEAQESESQEGEEGKEEGNPDYQQFQFENPMELLCFVYPDLTPYKWQAEETLRIASEYSQEDPLLYILRACNGSGKDSIIMASVVGWLTLCKIRHRVIMTSSSGVQLSTQSEKYVDDFFSAFNRRVGFECVSIKQRYYFCAQTGSEVVLFATDEAGKAEGYHPFASPKGAEMCIIVNEAKSVDPLIIEALSRCTGYSRRLEISTPGPPSGHYYNINKIALRYPGKREKGKWYSRIVTVKECPHISQATIDTMINEYGINSPIVRSSLFAEFAILEQDVVIQEALVSEAYEDQPTQKHWGVRKAGIDIGLVNDEAVFLVRQGNHILGQETFRLGDTVATAGKIIQLLRLYEVEAENAFADDGGVGKGVIDQLHDRGYLVNRVLFNNSALRKERFLNRGAEMYFFVARLIEERLLNFGKLSRDDILFSQLASREYFQNIKGKLQLRSKKDMKAEGRPSPDRADAFVLSFCGDLLEEFLLQVGRRTYKKEPHKEGEGGSPKNSGSNYASSEQLATQLALRESLRDMGLQHFGRKDNDNNDRSIFSIYDRALRGE